MEMNSPQVVPKPAPSDYVVLYNRTTNEAFWGQRWRVRVAMCELRNGGRWLEEDELHLLNYWPVEASAVLF